MNKLQHNIKEASLNDIESLISLWLELMAFHKGQSSVFDIDPNDPEGVRLILQKQLSDSNVRVLVSEVDSKIVGFIIARFQQGSEVFKLSRKGYIAETVITEKFRGQNIGDQLYNRAEEWLLSQNVDHIQLQVSVLNSPAQNFWKNKGFNAVTYVMNKDV